jgi:hypothetical protein
MSNIHRLALSSSTARRNCRVFQLPSRRPGCISADAWKDTVMDRVKVKVKGRILAFPQDSGSGDLEWRFCG